MIVCVLQDLETYANCYTGLAKLQRLVFIADRCPQLRVEALRMAIHYVQTTYNVNLYTQLHRKLQEAVRSVIVQESCFREVREVTKYS